MVALSFSLLSSLPANPFLGFEFNFSSVPGKAMRFKKNCIFLAVKCVPLYVSTKHFTDCSSYSHPFLSLSCLTSALLDGPSCQSCGLPGHGHDQTTSADIQQRWLTLLWVQLFVLSLVLPSSCKPQKKVQRRAVRMLRGTGTARQAGTLQPGRRM